jgi:hypothetical protein
LCVAFVVFPAAVAVSRNAGPLEVVDLGDEVSGEACRFSCCMLDV